MYAGADTALCAHYHIDQHTCVQNETCSSTHFISAGADAPGDCPGPGAGCVGGAEEVDVGTDGVLCAEVVAVAGRFWAGAAGGTGAGAWWAA